MKRSLFIITLVAYSAFAQLPDSTAIKAIDSQVADHEREFGKADAQEQNLLRQLETIRALKLQLIGAKTTLLEVRAKLIPKPEKDIREGATFIPDSAQQITPHGKKPYSERMISPWDMEKIRKQNVQLGADSLRKKMNHGE